MPEIPLISVIDNNHSVRREMATLIRSAGFEVEVFGTAEEFIRSNQVSCTECLVMNVQLPGMNGFQLQSHLASAGRHIPVVFVISSSEERARTLAHEAGAVSILDKPAGEKAVLKEIRSILKARDKDRGATQPSVENLQGAHSSDASAAGTPAARIDNNR